MAAAWPGTLPPAGLVGISGGPQSNAASFDPDIGETIDRRRARISTKTYNVELPPLNQTQYSAFLTFFETTLADGILPFTITDAFTGLTATYKFVHGDMPYREEKLTSALTRITFQLMGVGNG